MRRNYGRLAWTILLISFACCVILAVGVPWFVQSTVRHSYTGQSFSLDVQEGNLLVTCPGTNVPIAVVNRQDDLCQGREDIQIDAGPADQGVLHIRPRTALTATLSSVQIYRGTQLGLQQATTPRFPRFSAEPDRVILYMDRGRIRVSVPSNLTRTLQFQVTTPHALVQLSGGSASVEVTNQETQVIAHEGKVSVLAISNRAAVELESAQRVAVPTGDGLTAVKPAERNLLTGPSEFRDPIGQIWKLNPVDPQIPDESAGEATNMIVEGRYIVDFSRVGVGFAETGIRQELNRDIHGFRSLQLRIVLRVLQQNVPVCGTQGTECPVMVRIEYIDAEGGIRSWQQGFYYLPDPNVPPNPPFCVTCNPRNVYIPVIPGIWYPYESPNLISEFAKVGPAPVLLRSIYIYASGHTYQSQVAEVELNGQE
jgi:hypothetical protein